MQTSQFVYSKVPFVRIVIPFILGIILFHYLSSIPVFYGVSIVVALFLILLLFQTSSTLRSNYKSAPYWGIILTFALVFSGYSLSSFKSLKSETFSSKSVGFVMGKIMEQPSEKERSIKTVVEINAILSNNEWIQAEGRIILYFQKDSKTKKLKTGDQIIFEPNLQEVKNAGNPEEFDYKQYLAYHLISQQGYIKSEKWQLVQAKAETGLFAFAESVREKLISILRKNGLSGENFAVASAISLGYTNELDAEVKQSYAATGAMHILSVSGLHVGIVYIVLDFLLFFLTRKRYLRVLKAMLIILFLWGYALLTGLSPSVLRAAAMLSFVVAGKAFNRQANIYNSLSASAFVLLAYNPFLLFDVGFQLSYLAVLGIVYFHPLIYKIIYIKNKWTDKVWILTSVGIAAQLTTLPLSLYYFHQFPNYFLITGLLVIPLSTIIIYLIIFLFFISPWEWGASVTGKGLYYLVDFMNSSIKTIESWPGALTSDIPFNSVQVLLFYSLLAFITLFIVYKRILYLRLLLVCITGILGTGLITKVFSLSQHKFFVYNINGISSINFIDGSNNVLFSDIEKQKPNFIKSLKGNWLSLGVESERVIPFSRLKDQFLFTNLMTTDNENLFFKKNFFDFYGCRILMLRENFTVSEKQNISIPMDYLILSNDVSMNLTDILTCIKPKLVIIDSSNSNWKTEKWIKEAKDLKVEYFAVSRNGAFVADI